MRPADQSPASQLSPDSSGGQHLPLAVLRQYVAGTLSAAEQHRVEAHTLTCARCADLLEGLSQTDLATTDQALSDLQTRLRARLAEETPDATPVVPMWPWRQLVAAVLLLLVGTGVWLGVRRTTEGPAAAPQVAMRQIERKAGAMQESLPKPNQTPQKSGANAEVADHAIAAAPVPAQKEIAPVATKLPRVLLRAQRQQQATSAKAPADDNLSDASMAASDGFGSVEGVVSAKEPQADTTQFARGNAAPVYEQKQGEYAKAKSKAANTRAALAGRIAGIQTEPASAAATPGKLEGQIASAAPAPAGMRVVRGRVTDRSSGAGLPGVTVLAKGTAIGSSTAADGSFSLLVPESVKTIAFHSIGFSSSEQAINSADSTLALALAPDTKSLNEVVVVRRERPPAPMSIGALPAGGYQAFRAYLKQELQYPEKALKDGKEGNVKLSFVVAEDGSLENIKVVRGLSEECDAEAIRLLKEGPKWYPAIQKGRRTARTVEITVSFRVNE
ncbi:TonB family protein [Hymenobacter sp.]|jgi:TonB family protein|uniref:TonB family protein n=1 Tax=Hymenobacter sp. TaxID=1898978 RepID=UPI002ED7B9AE